MKYFSLFSIFLASLVSAAANAGTIPTDLGRRLERISPGQTGRRQTEQLGDAFHNLDGGKFGHARVTVLEMNRNLRNMIGVIDHHR